MDRYVKIHLRHLNLFIFDVIIGIRERTVIVHTHVHVAEVNVIPPLNS